MFRSRKRLLPPPSRNPHMIRRRARLECEQLLARIVPSGGLGFDSQPVYTVSPPYNDPPGTNRNIPPAAPVISPPQGDSGSVVSPPDLNIPVEVPIVAVPTTDPASTSAYLPFQVRHAYGFDTISNLNGTGQTIAIIVAYDDPNIASDLASFDQALGLPAPPSFTKVNQTGGNTYPPTDPSGTGVWELEAALDVEWVHSIAPGANILLVEANTATFADLFAGVDYAKAVPGVTVVSMSFGQKEVMADTAFDSHFVTPAGHAGVTFLAASGDTGAAGAPEYPSVSPNVVAVGGTALVLDTFGNYPIYPPVGGATHSLETGWLGSGGGQSTVETRPSYQSGVQPNNNRAVPDVAYVANRGTQGPSGVLVYDSFMYNGQSGPYYDVGGTSVGTPQWAGLIALVDQSLAAQGIGSLDGRSQTLPKLYQLTQIEYHDILSGSNGTSGVYYTAGPGYDLVTGRGTPTPDIIYDLANPNLSPNQRFVAHVYLDLLQRPPDSGGLSYWTSQLDTQALTRQQVASQFDHSQGYYINLVEGYYNQYLGRHADSNGSSFFVSQLISGQSNEYVQATILSTDEYFVKNGNNNPAFLHALWKDLLNRDIDGGALSYFQNGLNSGQTNRFQVAQAVLASQEYRTDLADIYFLGFLHRQGDSGGLSYFATQLGNGVTDENVLAQFLGTDEFFNRGL